MSMRLRLLRSHAMTIDPMFTGSSASIGLLDAASQAWVDGLHASGAAHDRCGAQLHELLLRVARHEADGK